MSDREQEPTASAEDAEGIAEGARAFGVMLDGQARARLAAFVGLFLRWNRSINLASLRSDDELVRRHLADSFALAAMAGSGAGAAIDVGSGGGLPAVPLAVMLPAMTFRLFEPNRKKAAFLRTAVRELELTPRVRVETEAVESPVAPRLAGQFDLALSRATLAPPVWLALGRELARDGGRVAVFAAGQSDADLPEAEASLAYREGRRLLLFGK